MRLKDRINVFLKIRGYRKAKRKIEKLAKSMERLGDAAEKAGKAFQKLKDAMPIDVEAETK